jgi:hypothetical protein
MSSDVKSAHLRIVKPATDAERGTRTTLDAAVVTPSVVKSWKAPPFQRPLKENSPKLADVAQEIRATEIIPGVITLGVIGKELWLIDGQHRVHAFLSSERDEAFVDLRYAHFSDMAEMSKEFKKLNGKIANMTPDDLLRAEEQSNAVLRRVRRECPFVGYGQVRRNPKAPVLSMSALLRCWFGTAPEVPSLGGLTANEVVERLTEAEAQMLIDFAKVAFNAWGSDIQHAKLWTNLNLAVCMWLYRRLVIHPYSSSTKRLTKELFTKCMMSVAADGTYSDWLVGRMLRERDRSPAYSRVKGIFARRLEAETGEKPRLPSPEWGGR